MTSPWTAIPPRGRHVRAALFTFEAAIVLAGLGWAVAVVTGDVALAVCVGVGVFSLFAAFFLGLALNPGFTIRALPRALIVLYVLMGLAFVAFLVALYVG